MATKTVTCSDDGCNMPPRSSRQSLCEKHYTRLRRNGTTKTIREVMPPAQEIVRNDGYVLEHMPSHPLWGDTHGRIYQHRRVFYDAYGKGPFACHWCGTCVDWGNVQVDRVNAIRSDNALSNLVASCANCNQKRGHDKMKATQQAKIEWQGECLTAGQWAERIGISRQSLMHRLRSGWDLGRALTEGRGVTGPK